jgi:hypothetical protein
MYMRYGSPDRHRCTAPRLSISNEISITGYATSEDPERRPGTCATERHGIVLACE